MKIENDQYYIDALRFSESVRDLDERSALKIAMALASVEPELFSKLLKIAKNQNLVPNRSTLTLTPVPRIPVEK